MLDELRKIYTPKLLTELSPEQIGELQESLFSLGYEVTTNGILGTQTANAFAEWKRSRGLKDFDSIGLNSLAALECDLEKLQEYIEV